MADPRTDPRRDVVFAERRDQDGFYRRSIRLADDGALLIEGHDLGAGVEAHFGFREYEFVRTVPAAGVAALASAFGVDGDALLAALRARFETTFALETYLEDAGIETTFWSRVGD